MEQGRNFSLKIIRIRKEDEGKGFRIFSDFEKNSNLTKFSLNPRKGIYECCAINRAGIGRAVIHLTVKEMEYFRSVVNDRIVSVDELKDAYLSG